MSFSHGTNPDPSSPPVWTKDVFTERLARGRERRLAARSLEPGADNPGANNAGVDTAGRITPRRRGLRLAAAVTGPFDPRTFRSAGDGVQTAGAFDVDFADDCLSLTNDTGWPRWILKPEVRRQALAALSETSAWARALDANAELDASDPVHGMFRRVTRSVDSPLESVVDRPLDLGGLSLPELAALAQIVEWSVTVPVPLPLAADIALMRDRKALLAPFETIAGEHFVGRRDELRELRSFVDALASQSALEAIERTVNRVLGKPHGALVLQAPGGMGKSALIARFILDHTSGAPSQPLKFAYLDWESPTLVAQETETMLAEITRQLALQYQERALSPDLLTEIDASLRAYRQEAAGLSAARGTDPDDARTRVPSPEPNAASSPPGNTPPGHTPPGGTRLDEIYRARGERAAAREKRLDDFARSLGGILARLTTDTPAPILVVLDTFERVQRYGLTEIEAVRRPLELLQAACPSIKVLIATRAPLETFVLSGQQARQSQLKPLERDAAASLLRRKGVEEGDAAKLAAHLDGSPLSLALAARIYAKQGLSGVEGISVRKWLIFSVDEGEIQGRLYGRYLDQIEDLDVRRLAHPGLIVRRIDADVIARVLAQPCGLILRDANAATDLFERLRREITLVTPAGDGTGAVRHRTDVRRLMLTLMRRDDPARADEIHRRAIAYYTDLSNSLQPTSTPWARAEEIYHRLARDEAPETVDKRWVSGLEPYLQEAIEELPLRGKRFLATRIGVALGEGELAQASLDDRERQVFNAAERLLDSHQAEKALVTLSEQKERSPTSRLFRLEAKALSMLGRSALALAKASDAIGAAAREGDKAQLADMLFLSAELSYRDGDLKQVPVYLERAIGLAAESTDDARVLSGLVLLRRTHAALKDVEREAITVGRLAAALERWRVGKAAAKSPFSRFEAEAVRAAEAELASPRDLEPENVVEYVDPSPFVVTEPLDALIEDALTDEDHHETQADAYAIVPETTVDPGEGMMHQENEDTSRESLEGLFSNFNKGLSS